MESMYRQLVEISCGTAGEKQRCDYLWIVHLDYWIIVYTDCYRKA